jgi:hypothetical protein
VNDDINFIEDQTLGWILLIVGAPWRSCLPW